MKPLRGIACAALWILASCGDEGTVHLMDVPPSPVSTGNPWGHECVLKPGEACQIDIDVSNGRCEPAQKQVKVPQDRLVHWKLKGGTGQWKFATNGIDFTAAKSDPGQGVNPQAGAAFDQSGGGGTPQYAWHVKPGAPQGGYPYTITLVGPDNQSCKFDPGIWV